MQYHSLKAGHDYGQYVRDARNAGKGEIASFFEEVMAQDATRIVARAWIRVIWACWHTGTAYDPALHQAHQQALHLRT